MMYFPRPSLPIGNAAVTALLALFALTAFASLAGNAQSPNPARLLLGQYPFVDLTQDHGYLGIEFVDVDADKAQALRLKDPHGAVVTLVDHDAPAGKIGLHVNDVVVGLNGQPIRNALDLRTMIRGMAPGSKVSLQIIRDGSVQTQSATLVDRKAMEREVWGKIYSKPDAGTPVPQNGFLAGGGTAIPGNTHMSLFTGSLRVGVMVEPLTPQMAQMLGIKSGLMVKQVTRKSEADAAGLQAMDIIVKVDTDQIVTEADWDRALRASAGKPMQITIMRDKRQQILTLQLSPKHRGAVEAKEPFGLSEDDETLIDRLNKEIASELDSQFAKEFSAQAEDLRDLMSEFNSDPRQMDEFRRQMDELKRQVKDLKAQLHIYCV